MKTNTVSRRHLVGSVAFTLLELLVVVGVLALLGSTLATSVATTKPGAYTYQCRNNLRQLGFAWKMYADDNQGRLVWNRNGSDAGKHQEAASWAGGWLDNAASTDNTNIDLLINHQRYPFGAHFGPYLKTARVFKCPADLSTALFAGQQLPRVRSVSMNNCMGANARLWTPTGRFALYTKFIQVKSPSRIFVFVDEREDSINDAVFLTDPASPYRMVDFPASYHAGAANLSFADGHVETHRWIEPRTIPPLKPGVLLSLNVPQPRNEDVTWLQQHASEPR